LTRDDNRRRPCGVRGANDGSRIPGITHVVQDHRESFNRDIGYLDDRESHRGQDRLRALGVGDLFEDTLTKAKHSHTGVIGALHRLGDRGAAGRRDGDVERFEFDIRLEGGVDQIWSFENADPFAPP
jgi:hypothetical protein